MTNDGEVKSGGIGAGSILRRKANGAVECVTDELVVEEPLEIRIGKEPLVVTMRTPGHDEDLAAGFLLSEGVVLARKDVRSLVHSRLTNSHGNILTVTLSAHAKFSPKSTRRFGAISTSCGLCGKTSIESIHRQFSPIDVHRAVRIEESKLLELSQRLRDSQENFSRTGGIHGAAIFHHRGDLVVLREDIGRHNAVDKAIGFAFLDEMLPLNEHVLVVSGRSSLEIVQKAVAAGIPIVASVSAPSTLAVNFARASGQTLIGFLRPPTFNIYSHVERIVLDSPAG